MTVKHRTAIKKKKKKEALKKSTLVYVDIFGIVFYFTLFVFVLFIKRVFVGFRKQKARTYTYTHTHLTAIALTNQKNSRFLNTYVVRKHHMSEKNNKHK